MKMTDHQRATVLKAQNEALTEKQMDFTQYVPYHMQVVNSVAIDTDTYQREVEEDKVRDIVAGFNEYIANEPKLSYRNGKYYAFDGQHTIEARKRLNGNKDCDIVCKVFFGMTPEEEARLFAAQTGTSSKPSAGIKLRAKVIGQDREAINFVNANKAVGIHPSYMNASGDCRLRCINTALHEYLATLSEGEHTLTIRSKSGDATAKFTVEAAESAKSTAWIWIVLAVVILGGGAAAVYVFVIRKRKTA